jgi:hypothetical protein
MNLLNMLSMSATYWHDFMQSTAPDSAPSAPMQGLCRIEKMPKLTANANFA